ncbi:hypothetical protein F4860DRAFT_508115 [Xylaria cubensis]|nr:hypothetical protein F4860DRAFT_508115 [Xylaria cubensis]
MENVKRFFHYLTNLEWTERIQHECIFCDRANFGSIVYEDEDLIAIDNIRPAGQFHWLIMPKLHIIRDIEALDDGHIPLLQAMDAVKNTLLEQELSELPPPSVILAGYHRGRRPLVHSVYYPDIVSIHHLHLHVIVRPRIAMWLFKYPTWLPLMWKSDATVMQEITQRATKSN